MDDDYTPEEQKLYEELYNAMGAKIRFKGDGYLQEGIVLNIIPEAKRVLFRHVFFILPNERVFSGDLKYYFKDLADIEVVATAKELNPYPVNEYIANLMKEIDEGKTKKYSYNQVLFNGRLSDHSDDEEEEEVKEEEFELVVPTDLEEKVPHDSVILDAFDLEWEQAVRHIKKQEVIGVSFHNARVSRLGKLSWVCIGTTYCVFLFDIEKLGVDAFNNGLRVIFEDLTIKKVIHGCRFPSDCLAHKYGTKLANVFDTLVADFIASKQVHNDKYKYKYVQSLNSCVMIHLEVLPEFTYARDRYLEKNGGDDYLSKRPLRNALRDVLIKDTIYLLLLHETLAKKLLDPFHINVERSLNVIAGASKEVLDTIGDEISSPDSVSPTVLMHGVRIVQFRKPVKKGPISLKCKFRHPITGEFIDVKTYHSSNDVGSNNSKNNSVERQKEKTCYKENYNSTMEKGSEQKLPTWKGTNRSVVVGSMIAKPSGRHMDEVYHKLVNNQQLRSQNAQSVINVKPPEKYTSKFTMRIPPECAAFSDNASRYCVSDQAPLPDYSETWAKIRAESCDVPQSPNKKYANMKFVPAGMRC